MKELMSQGLILVYNTDISEDARRKTAEELRQHIISQKGVAYMLSDSRAPNLGSPRDIRPFVNAVCIEDNGYVNHSPAIFHRGVAYIGIVRARNAAEAYDIYSKTNLPRPIYGPGETGNIFILPTDVRDSAKYAWIDDTALTKSELIKALDIRPEHWGLQPHISRNVTHAFYQLIEDIYALGVFPFPDETFIQSMEHVISLDTTHSKDILDLIQKRILPNLI